MFCLHKALKESLPCLDARSFFVLALSRDQVCAGASAPNPSPARLLVRLVKECGADVNSKETFSESFAPLSTVFGGWSSRDAVAEALAPSFDRVSFLVTAKMHEASDGH